VSCADHVRACNEYKSHRKCSDNMLYRMRNVGVWQQCVRKCALFEEILRTVRYHLRSPRSIPSHPPRATTPAHAAIEQCPPPGRVAVRPRGADARVRGAAPRVMACVCALIVAGSVRVEKRGGVAVYRMAGEEPRRPASLSRAPPACSAAAERLCRFAPTALSISAHVSRGALGKSVRLSPPVCGVRACKSVRRPPRARVCAACVRQERARWYAMLRCA